MIERAKHNTGEKITTEENFSILATYANFITGNIFCHWGERFKKDPIDDLVYRLTSAWGELPVERNREAGGLQLHRIVLSAGKV